MTGIVIFNDCFSDNVGDGLIAGSLEFGLRSLAPELGLKTIDLAGRVAPAGGHMSGSAAGWARRAWGAAPAAARRALSRHRLEQVFRGRVVAALEDADAVVIGGGQLITGSSSFFAERIAIIAREAAMRSLPLYLHAVGVSDPRCWQASARALLENAFGAGSTLAGVTVRDAESAQHWRFAFAGIVRLVPPAIAPDPALLAAQAYATLVAEVRRTRAEQQWLSRTTPKRIGIGVIAPAVVDFLATDLREAVVPKPAFFLHLAEALVEAECHPVFFSNGSGEDEAYLTELAHYCAAEAPSLRGRIHFKPRPRRPEDLVDTVAGLDAVIAHRLHANILAYALRVPHVGLDWDHKLRSFLGSVGRGAWLVTGCEAKGADAARLILSALDAGVEGSGQAVAVGEAWSAIGRLLGRIEGGDGVYRRDHPLDAPAAAPLRDREDYLVSP